MKNVLRIFSLLVLLVLPLLAVAEDGVQHRVVLRSGRVVVGEVVLQNDEVLILKNAYGTRFQYPVEDILEIAEIKDDAPQTETKETSSRSVSNVKKTSLGFRAVGGVLSLDGRLGSAFGGDFRIGANNVAQRHIFLGGQVGYRAMLLGNTVYSVIPLNVAMELPLTDNTHAPMLGANIGYGIGLGKIRGGINAGLSLAYRYHFSRTGAFHIGLAAELQQLAKFPHTQTIETDQTFYAETGRTAVMGMIALGVLF